MQKADVWSLGVMLLDCWLFINQTECVSPRQLNAYDLRGMGEEERLRLVRTLVSDGAVAGLIGRMLMNRAARPTGEELLVEPIVKLYRYFVYDSERDLADVVSNPAACLPYISGMTLLNRSKAIVCMLGLMNLYKTAPGMVLENVERTEAYIPMIEILTVCLKDKDNDFIGLHENALRVLAQILGRSLNSEAKSKCIVGGLVALVINAIEKDVLKYIPPASPHR